MILHRVTVQHLGPYPDQASAGGFEPGLNVIDAPNETGKSTLFLAATRALFDRHTSKGAEIRALQPVDTKLGPMIEVEFETQAGRFQLRKRFLESPESRLRQWNGEDWRLLAEADRADDHVLELLGAPAKARGASKPEHWGLLRMLWTRQGELVEWPQWTPGETQALPATMVSAPLEPEADALLARWRKAYEESFTRTGQIRANGPLEQAARERDQWAAEVEELQARLQTVEAKAQRYERLSRERERLKDELDTRVKTEAALDEAQRQTALAHKEIQGLEAAFVNAEAELRTIREDLKALERNERDREALEREIADHQQRHEAIQKTLKENEPLRESARQRVDAATRQTNLARESRERFRRLRELSALAEESRRLTQVLEKARAKRRELQDLETEWTKIPEISSTRLQELRELDRRRLRLESTIQAQGLRWRFTTDGTRRVSISEDAREAEDWITRSGETSERETGPEATIRLEGWGEITVRSGAQTVADLQRELNEVRDAWHSALRSHGMDSLEALEAAAARFASMEQEIQWRRAALQDDLGDYESVAAVEDARAEREQARARRIAQDQWSPEELDLGASAIDSALARYESQIAHFDQAVQRARDEATTQDQAAEAGKERLANLERELSGQRALRQRLQIERETIQSRRRGNLEEILEDKQAEFVRAEARLVHSQTTLPKDWATIDERRQRAVSAAEACRLEFESLREESERLRGELEAYGAQAWFSQLTDAKERWTRAESRYLSLRREALAAGYLASLLERKRAAAVERALAPLEERLSRAFAELSGAASRRVFLGPQLDLLGVGERRDRIIPFRQLSQGAKEQLLLALRAAIAQSLADVERPCLVLDDALVNTDPERQERVLSFLDTLADDAQIILLTCDAARYRGVGKRLPIHHGSPSL